LLKQKVYREKRSCSSDGDDYTGVDQVALVLAVYRSNCQPFIQEIYRPENKIEDGGIPFDLHDWERSSKDIQNRSMQ